MLNLLKSKFTTTRRTQATSGSGPSDMASDKASDKAADKASPNSLPRNTSTTMTSNTTDNSSNAPFADRSRIGASIVEIRNHARVDATRFAEGSACIDGDSCAPGVLSSTAADAHLLAKRPALAVTMNDLMSATDHAPIYSSPGVRYRSVLSTEDIGQPILWSLDLDSLKHVMTHALLLPWDTTPSMPGMYEQLLAPISQRVAALLTEVRGMQDFTPEFIARLNDLLPHRRIEWIGTLRDLAHGDSQHARETRLRYFLMTGAIKLDDAFADTPETVAAIPTDENERFLSYLRGELEWEMREMRATIPAAGRA